MGAPHFAAVSNCAVEVHYLEIVPAVWILLDLASAVEMKGSPQLRENGVLTGREAHVTLLIVTFTY